LRRSIWSFGMTDLPVRLSEAHDLGGAERLFVELDRVGSARDDQMGSDCRMAFRNCA